MKPFLLILPAILCFHFSSRAQSCSTGLLPYAQNFDAVITPDLPSCITVEDSNNDFAVWKTRKDQFDPGAAQSSPNCMYFYNDNFFQTPSDDWFFLPAFTSTAGHTYKISFGYKAANNIFPEALQVKFGNAATAAAMTSAVLYNNSNILNINYATATADFMPGFSGPVYIGFRCYTSSPGAFGLYIDDVLVTDPAALPLPLSLLSFNGSRQGDYNVLQWKTAASFNTHRFVVEYSLNGSSFTAAGDVAAGNTAGNMQYSFKHAAPAAANIFYRLRIQDNNGTEKISPVLPLRGKATGRVVIAPTIITNNTLSVLAEQPVNGIVITDAYGRVVLTRSINRQQGYFALPLPALPRGAYIVTWQTGTSSKSSRVIVQ